MTLLEKYKKLKLNGKFHRIKEDDYIGLPVDILIDLYGVCDDEEIPYCIFFRNGYLDGVHKYLPLIICDTPYVPYKANIKIPYSYFHQLCVFVVKHKDDLISLTNGSKWLSDDFWVENFLTERALSKTEKKQILLEMSRVKKEITWLPMDIWLNNGKTYEKSGHYKRIKFKQENNSSNITTGWGTLTIPDMKISSTDKKSISPKNLNLLKKFCEANMSMIEDTMDGNLDMGHFLDHIIQLDQNGNLNDNPYWKTPYSPYGSAGFGIKIIENVKEGLFAYVKNNEILFGGRWFAEAHPFNEVDGEMIAWVRTDPNDEHFSILNLNGELTKIKDNINED